MRNFGAAPRLRIVENATPLGVARNFEQAALACRGDLIALSDQDDRWRPERLARMASEFEARPDLLLLHSDARLIDSAGADLGRSLFYAYEVKRFEIEDVHRGRAFDALLRRNLATGATILFRRSLLQHAAPFPPHWLHDEWLAIVAAAIGRIDLLEEKLIDYRQHDLNQIGAERENFAAKVRRAIAPRGAKYRERVERAEYLLARLRQLEPSIAPGAIEKAQGKLAHQQFRAELPANRLVRWVPVIGEALTGRYARYGRGAQYVLQDLFEFP